MVKDIHTCKMPIHIKSKLKNKADSHDYFLIKAIIKAIIYLLIFLCVARPLLLSLFISAVTYCQAAVLAVSEQQNWLLESLPLSLGQ